MNRERKSERIFEKLVDRERKDKEKDKKIEYLESETERLRDDRNEQREYCQQLYEELWGAEEYPEYEEAENWQNRNAPKPAELNLRTSRRSHERKRIK